VIENVLTTAMYALSVPLSLGHQWLLVPIGLGLVAIEYFAFKTLIVKLNIPTLGREENREIEETEMVIQNAEGLTAKETGLATIVQGLGGVSNIENIYNCFTRLRLDVFDESKVDIQLLKTYPSSGVVDKQKHIQIIIGLGVEDIRLSLETFVEEIKKGEKSLPSLTENHHYFYSAADGEIVPINEIPDEVFASKALGNGFAVKNHDGRVYSPVNGKIINVFPTKHAIGIEDESGQQVLVHMGIDTVSLNGQPFAINVETGNYVKHGDLLATINTDEVKKAGKEDMVIVVALENQKGKLVNHLQKINHEELAFEI
jgi:PTS system arbutin-like IIC component